MEADYKITNKKGKGIFTDVSLHPGEVLTMGIETRGIKESVFAELLAMNPSHFSELLHGKRHVSVTTALKVEKLLGISADCRMRVRAYYDLFLERNKESNAA